MNAEGDGAALFLDSESPIWGPYFVTLGKQSYDQFKGGFS